MLHQNTIEPLRDGFGDGLGDGIGDGFWDILGNGPGEQVTNGDNVLSWLGENRAIFGESFGEDFVESRICAIWPILDDGLLKNDGVF